jgi:hypothetical protein
MMIAVDDFAPNQFDNPPAMIAKYELHEGEHPHPLESGWRSCSEPIRNEFPVMTAFSRYFAYTAGSPSIIRPTFYACLPKINLLASHNEATTASGCSGSRSS